MERCFDVQSPIDFNKIKTIFGNVENLAKLMHDFMESLTIDKHFLEKAYFLGDWALIEKIAHRIRGGAVYFGAVFLEDACKELEHCLLGFNDKNKDNLYVKTISAIVVVEDYVWRYLSSPA